MTAFLVSLNASLGASLLMTGEPLRAAFNLLVALLILLVHWEEIV